MHPSRFRARRPAAALAVALGLCGLALLGGASTARAAAQELTTDKGVVQSVSSTTIVLRGLDGSAVALALGPATRIRLNGAAATVGDLVPGLVASVTHNGGRPARVVRAFGTLREVVEGTVRSATRGAVTVERPDGTVTTIALGPATTVKKFGRPAGRRAIQPGQLVRVTHRPGSPALVVAVVRRLR